MIPPSSGPFLHTNDRPRCQNEAIIAIRVYGIRPRGKFNAFALCSAGHEDTIRGQVFSLGHDKSPKFGGLNSDLTT
jgi:hypothetical protein